MWLYKQPSLSEGLDVASSDEEESECRITDAIVISNPADANEHYKFSTEEDDQDDVFTENIVQDNSSTISKREERTRNNEPPHWLVRAISICSEGGDLEALASEAEIDKFSTELDFPEAFCEYGSTREEGSNDHRDDLSGEQKTSPVPHLVNHDPPGYYTSPQFMAGTSTSLSQQIKDLSPLQVSNSWEKENDSCKTKNPSDLSKHPLHHNENGSLRDSNFLKDSSSVCTTEATQSLTSSIGSGKSNSIMRQRTISDLGNICIGAKGSDYLYAAGHTIHQALNCEVNGMYEEAFSLYRTCVGLLLCGVQGMKQLNY